MQWYVYECLQATRMGLPKPVTLSICPHTHSAPASPCPTRCNSYVAADKRNVLEVAPNILQVTLKRYTVSGQGGCGACIRGSVHSRSEHPKWLCAQHTVAHVMRTGPLCSARHRHEPLTSQCMHSQGACDSHSLPAVAALQVGRFVGKLRSHVSFSETLDLGPYLAEDCLDEQPAQYSLFGVVVHQGSMASWGECVRDACGLALCVRPCGWGG